MVKREFGTRHWYSLVRLDNDRVEMGGLQSEGEAEAWAMEAGHTLVNAPDKKSTAALRPPFATGSAGAAVGPSQEGVRPVPRPRRPAPSRPTPRPRLVQLTKEPAPCCVARALPDGRPVIGFCGPDCIRRAS